MAINGRSHVLFTYASVSVIDCITYESIFFKAYLSIFVGFEVTLRYLISTIFHRYEHSIQAYLPYDRQWIKQKIFQHLKKLAH